MFRIGTHESPAAVPSPAIELAWLANFQHRIVCKACRRHWRQIVQAHPPDFSSRYAYFRWTVRAHNEVNKLIGKPVFPFAQACKVWRFNRKELEAIKPERNQS